MFLKYYIYSIINRSKRGLCGQRWIPCNTGYHKAIFRYDVIPHTGCYKSGIRGIFRNPHTTSERRKLSGYAVDKELQEYRVKMNNGRYRMLPEAWDDITIADNYNKGWKRTKKRKQWMHPERLPKCKRTGDIII